MGQELLVEGGVRLSGCCLAHAAKNAALPIMAASLLCHGPVLLTGLPDLTDFAAMGQILTALGASVSRESGSFFVDAEGLNASAVEAHLACKLRASTLLLGPLLARTGEVTLGASGGCAIGKRPIDLHIEGLKKLGAILEDAPCGQTRLSAPKGLHGCDICLSFPSVGATENILTAAVLAEGTTRLFHGASEPEVLDLARFLHACGARIFADGRGYYEIRGVRRLHGCLYAPMFDRIETATYLAAAAATGGEVLVEGVSASCLPGVLERLTAMGCRMLQGKESLFLAAPRRLRAAGPLKTAPYPGFPTDLQAIFTALFALAKGETVVEERIFEGRFSHVPALRSMGAHIQTDGFSARIYGKKHLCGAEMTVPDLRSGGALLIAALAAEGKSRLSAIHWMDRGYEKLDGTLSSMGGRVKRQECADGNEKITANDPGRI